MFYTAKERERYNEYRSAACERLGISKNEYNALRRLAQALCTWDERRCNGDCTDEEYEAAVNAICDRLKRFNLAFFHQSDPRGCSLYVSNSKELNFRNYTDGVGIY